MNKFSLGSTTSMVHQNTTQSFIPYPQGTNQGSLILASRTQTFSFWPTCHISMPKSTIQKQAATTSKKGTGQWFEHPDTFNVYMYIYIYICIYIYGQNRPTIPGTVAILVMWWVGEQQNRHKIAQNAHGAKTFEMLPRPYQVC